VTPDRLAAALRSVIPDPLVIALLLTVVALVAASGAGLAAGAFDPMALVAAWVGGAVEPGGGRVGGLWSLLAFSMQMCLILVTGAIVAGTAPVRAALERLARVPRGARSAAALVAVAAMGLGLVHWGLGLIGGAVLAREVGRALHERGVSVHYPALAAGGYAGLCVWHGGLSGSAPLKVTTVRDLAEVLGPTLAARVGGIPLTETILSPRNLAVNAVLLVIVPLVLAWLVPSDPARRTPPPAAALAPPEAPPADRAPGLAGALEEGPVLPWIFAILVAAWAVPWWRAGGAAALTPDHLNLLFLAVGFVLAGSPARLMRLATSGATACAGILVQFPLYGGILGVLAAGGVIARVAGWLPTGAVGLSLATFFGAGAINLFVPSGGGQWAVQGPIVVQAAVDAGVPPARVVLALAYGDQWTNLFQPFWALPLLGITGARAGDLLGHTAIVGIVVGIVFAVGVAVG
jgi:short-chain fatty acids transporter